MANDYNTKGERRDAKSQKRRYGMRTSGRSVFLIQDIDARKGAEAREKGAGK